MKNRLRQHFLLGLMLITALFSLVSTSVFAAGNDSTYLTPNVAGQKVQVGSNFTVDVDGHLGGYWWGGGPSSTNGTITYPADLLQVASIDATTNAAFPHMTVDSSKPGTITYKGNTNPYTYTTAWSDAHIFRIYFKALTAGIANLNITAASYDTGSGTKTGSTYTIVAPPPVVTPTPTPKPSTSPKPSTTPKPSTSVSPTPTPSETPSAEATTSPTTSSDGGLSISNVAVTTTRQKNSITWTINNADAAQTFTYGMTKSDQKSEATVIKLDDNSFTVSPPNLKAGTLYYFSIKAATSDKLQGSTYGGTLTTRGYPVQLTVQQNGILAANAKVKIGERSFTANKDAIITTELADGPQTASITAANSSDSYTVEFAVEKKTIPANSDPAIQLFTLNAIAASTEPVSHTNVLGIIFGGIGATLLVIGGVTGFLLYRRRQNLEGYESASVDTDLLNASYGTVLTDVRTQTPEPNLDTRASAVTEFTPDLPVETPVLGQEAVIQPSIEGVDPSVATYDPIAQPLEQQSYEQPQQYDMPAAEATAATTPPTVEPIIDEQLSAPVTSVESIEEPPATADPTAEQAIYHPETGELDIIHGHDTPTAPTSSTTAPQTQQTTQPGGA